MKKGNVVKEGTYVVLKEEMMSCGCSEAKIGTIGRVLEEGPDEDGEIKIQFCPNGCTNYVKYTKVSDDYDQNDLGSRFAFADNYKYASVR